MQDVECVYCGTAHRPSTITKTRRVKLGIPALSAEWTRSSSAVAEIDCAVCGHKYRYFRNNDWDYLMRHVVFTKRAFETLKTAFGAWRC